MLIVKEDLLKAIDELDWTKMYSPAQFLLMVNSVDGFEYVISDEARDVSIGMIDDFKPNEVMNELGR